ncbi:MAG: DNA-formamidopyrimidine glycosylase [Candidatus Omnitrophica bacterium]|nr:DNA-formamidopyrimidine glycosylase [Candidatus Omnitrophota bacterium]
MPELPEVETIKRELEKAILGKKIVDVIVKNSKVIKEPARNKFINGLKSAAIKNILRKGKALIFELSNGKYLVIHLRMTGQLVYPGTSNQARVSFKLSDRKLLDFNDRRLLGELRLVDNWQDITFFKGLGPEIYDLTADKFSQMLSKKITKIKPLLMDQTFLAGIGNLYAAESLFRAGIHPARVAKSLTNKEKLLLFKEIKDILNEAIRHRGSSTDQYVHLSGERGNYARYHRVYDRKGEPCVKCKSKIERISLGGRGTYFCPRCQK